MPRKTKAQKAAEAAAANAQATGTFVPPPAAPIVLTEDQNQLLFAYMQAQKYVQENCTPHINEMKRLRSLFVTSVMPTPVEGTTYIELGGGWRAKVVSPYKREMDQAQFAAVFEQLPEGTFERVATWTPKLVMKGYNELPEDQRAILDQCITTKPGSATLAVLEPNADDSSTGEDE